MGRPRDRVREQVWQERIGRWRRGTLTVEEFCARHGLSESAFRYWQRTITERNLETVDQTPAFVQVGVTNNLPTTRSLEVVLGCGRVVRVPAGFDAQTLRQLLAVLEVPSC